MRIKKGPGVKIYAIGVVMLALVLVCTFTIGRTTGQKSVLADTFIDNVSAKTISEMEDELAAGISQVMIREAVETQLSSEAIKEMIRQNIGNAITEEQLNTITETVLSEISSSVVKTVPQDYLTDNQRAEVKKMISEAVTENLGDADVDSITEEDIKSVKEQIYESLKGTVSSMIQENIKNYSYTLSESDIENITNKINVEDVVKKVVEEETVVSEADLSKLQQDITANIKDSIRTPVAGVDYLTASEVTAIEDSAAKKASQTVSTELTGVKNNLNTVQTSVSSMNSQISTLSAKVQSLENAGGNSVSDQDVQDLKNAVATINRNISDINTAAGALAGKVDITNGYLRRITANNGSIDEAEVVDTSGMSIAEFVNVLAGNDIEYTTAINQLYSYVTQLQTLVGGNYTTLSNDVASLQAGLATASGTITTLTQAITDEENARINAINTLSSTLGHDINDVNTALEEYKSVVSNTYATPAEIEEAKQNLQASITSLDSTITANKSVIDQLDTDTKASVSAIQSSIASMNATLGSNADDIGALETEVGNINSNVGTVQTSLAAETSAREQADNTLDGKITAVNQALDAYKATVANTYATPAEIAAAKSELETAVGELETALGTVESTAGTNSTNITAAQQAITTIQQTLASDESDIDSLQAAANDLNTAVSGLEGQLNALSESISGGTGDDEQLEQDAGSVDGSTILAKIGSLWNKLTALETKVNNTDTWATSVVLKNTTGTNSGKNVYYQENGTGIVYTLEGDQLNLNFKANSNVTLQYNASTPDIVVTYEQGEGYLKIFVDSEYKATAIAQDITIDSIHCESED